VLECFPLYKLHRVEITAPCSAQVEDRSNIRVTNARRRAGFAQKTKPRRFITEIAFADDLQRHGAVQIDVERLVSDPHRAATQLDWFAVFARHQLVVLKSFRWLLQRRLNCFLERRLAGLSATSKTLAKHADGTEFHCSKKLVAAARAGALGLRVHGPNRPLVAIRSENNTALQRMTQNRPSRPLAKLLSRSRNNCVFLAL